MYVNLPTADNHVYLLHYLDWKSTKHQFKWKLLSKLKNLTLVHILCSHARLLTLKV